MRCKLVAIKLGISNSPADRIRAQVVNVARKEVGQPYLRKYMESAFGKYDKSYEKLSWCGIFSLYVLHSAGLGKNIKWELGSGYLLKHLRSTKHPNPGDIVYYDNDYMHHAIVKKVEYVNGDLIVHTIDGNSTNALVTDHKKFNYSQKMREYHKKIAQQKAAGTFDPKKSQIDPITFFSIEKLVDKELATQNTPVRDTSSKKK